MLQYRLVNDTNDFAEGTSHKMVLFMIHNDVTYEHHVDQTYDTSRIIATMGSFIIDVHNEYIDAKYHSATFRLMPVGENIALIIKLRAEVESLKQQLSTRQTPPDYLPPNLSLLCTIEYLPWDTLEDLFYMYPLDGALITDVYSNRQHLYIKMPNIHNFYGFRHKMFNTHPHIFDVPIDLFDPQDDQLNNLIKLNKEKSFYYNLSKSCNLPYTQNKKINMHILNWITIIFRHYILQTAPGGKQISINCFITESRCTLQILTLLIPSYQSVHSETIDQYGYVGKFAEYKYRMNFYIDDWSAPPVVVYV